MKMAAAQIETFHWGTSLCPGDESWQPPHVKSVRQVKRKCWTKDRLYVGAAASSQEKTKSDDPSKTSQPPHPQFTIRINKTYSEGARIPEKQTIIKSLQKGSLFPDVFFTIWGWLAIRKYIWFAPFSPHDDLRHISVVSWKAKHKRTNLFWRLESRTHWMTSAEQTVSITKAVDGVREIYDDLNPAFEKWSGVPFRQAPVE